MLDNGYITLESLATGLNLPQKFLKELVKKGDIPFLNVNGRLKFSEPEVRRAIATLAEKSMADEQKRAADMILAQRPDIIV